MIVAVARKLAIALWRYVECGLVPEGAIGAGRLKDERSYRCRSCISFLLRRKHGASQQSRRGFSKNQAAAGKRYSLNCANCTP
jgi:hypothetical protein